VSAGTFTPRPGAAPLPRMILRQAALELRMQLRNGEQLLLTAVIPTLLLVLFAGVDVVRLGTGRRIDVLTPGILALAVMSTAFTGLAIGTGFERRYGVLKRLGTTPLPRAGLLTAKILAVLAVEVLQLVLLGAVALLMGWHPHGTPLAVGLLLLLGTAAFGGLGLLMAGTLKAEVTLALANLVYLLLLVGGGIIVPLDRFPDGLAHVLRLTPAAALTDGLRSVLQSGSGLPWTDLGLLAAWAVVGIGAASRLFRWE
jgi:ABC-2 type transport system permease protein